MYIEKTLGTWIFVATILLSAVGASILSSSPVHAGACQPNTGSNESLVYNGIITSPQLNYTSSTSHFTDSLPFPNTGNVCAIDQYLVPFNLSDFSTSSNGPGPLSYQGLKTTYYTKTQYNGQGAAGIINGNCNPGTTRQFQFTSNGAYNWDCDNNNLKYGPSGDVDGFLPASGNDQNQAVVIFVDGNLYFDDNFLYAYNSTTSAPYDDHGAVVFVVQKNIYIGNNVNTIDAVLIAGGIICASQTTPDNAGSCDSTNPVPKPLTVYGNLISLDTAGSSPITLNRLVANPPNTPSEVIHTQPKYLVLLKGILSQDLMQQTENTQYGN